MKLISRFASAVVCGTYSTYAMADILVCTPVGSSNCVLVVPEPSSLWLVGVGLAGAVLVARFFKK